VYAITIHYLSLDTSELEKEKLAVEFELVLFLAASTVIWVT
jgi:hypothetical protein